MLVLEYIILISVSVKYMMGQKLDDLHQNTIAPGFLFNAADYVYNSVWDYCGKKGLLNIRLIE
jgi:hypothetical protein